MMINNFHTHTCRCHHAYGADEEYVKSAIQAHMTQLGFSDHTPWHYDSSFQPTMRMDETQIDDYIQSLNSLKEKYKDQIDILIGLECEYFEKYMPWLKKMIKDKKIDYLILGNHYYQSDETHIYFGSLCSRQLLKCYVDECIKAIDTGLYSYIAHPDLINYDPASPDYRQEMTRLCRYAKKHHIPLEFNLLGYQSKRHYPHPQFWQIASENHNQAIIGFDAHSPSSLLDLQSYKQALEYLNSLHIEVIKTIKTLR